MERTSALVTPEVMKWARERARLDVDTAAKKLGRPPEDIRGWEDGTVVPSMAQARKASEVYKRSLAVFYLPEPPRDFDTLKDFRTLPGNADPAYSPALALLVRRLQARQEWLREYRLAEGHERLPFVGSASPRSSEESLAEDIRRTLRVTLEEQVRCPSRRDALNLWVDRAEDIGISICRIGGIEPEEARGIALADDIAPFIFVNAHDAYAARLFTLVHELAHLWIKQPGISNLQGIKQQAAVGDPAIEAFCNRTAALTLVDPSEFANRWQARDQSVTLEEQIEGIADHFNVSEEVIARRLLDRSVILVVDYERLRAFYHARWLAHAADERRRQKDSKGGPSYYRQKLQANGRILTQTVLSACSAGNITLRDACAVLGVRVNHLPKLAAVAGLPSAEGGSQ